MSKPKKDDAVLGGLTGFVSPNEWSVVLGEASKPRLDFHFHSINVSHKQGGDL